MATEALLASPCLGLERAKCRHSSSTKPRDIVGLPEVTLSGCPETGADKWHPETAADLPLSSEVASQLCRKLGLNEQIAVIEPRDWLSVAETGLEAASALGRLDIETCSLARRTA